MLIFTALWSLKTTHGWLAHEHDHAAHPVCSAAADHHSAHLHDESWAKEDCTLCAFVVSIPEPFVLPEWPVIFGELPCAAVYSLYVAPQLSKEACDRAMRRGPPAAA
jgi:hypothetical protein